MYGTMRKLSVFPWASSLSITHKWSAALMDTVHYGTTRRRILVMTTDYEWSADGPTHVALDSGRVDVGE
jgi:hypothetical protein